MRPELIVMLTHHDETVKDARQLFKQMKHLPVQHWGFKDVGLPKDEMKLLVSEMKDAGKTTYLEVVSLSEEEGLDGARVAVEAGFDVLAGTVYAPSIGSYAKEKNLKYFPFPGKIYGHPSILDGTIEEISESAKWLESVGMDGLDLLNYRYTGDASTLLKEVVKCVSIPVICAGSIATFDRIEEVRRANTWGFTIGSAFFEKKFLADGSFKENMMAVWNWLAQLEEKEKLDYQQLDGGFQTV